jgi:tight adherence protein C
MSLALITFISIFLLTGTGILLASYRISVASRLRRAAAGYPSQDRYDEDGHEQDRRRLRTQRLAEALDPVQKLVPKSPIEVSVARKRLMLAGYRQNGHLALLYAAKVIVPIVLVVLSTTTGLYHKGPFFVYASAIALGFLAPDFWLGWQIRKRQLELRLSLPEALDLLTVCVEAGLGLDQAIVRVSDEMRHSRPEIAEELAMINLEQRAGKTRPEALHNLAERTDVDSIRALAAMLIQTDQFGTSVAESLRVHAESLRTQRRQEVEEQAAKTTVKLIFPLVFCIFPSLFVVTLAPAFLKIMEAFEAYF